MYQYESKSKRNKGKKNLAPGHMPAKRYCVESGSSEGLLSVTGGIGSTIQLFTAAELQELNKRSPLTSQQTAQLTAFEQSGLVTYDQILKLIPKCRNWDELISLFSNPILTHLGRADTIQLLCLDDNFFMHHFQNMRFPVADQMQLFTILNNWDEVVNWNSLNLTFADTLSLLRIVPTPTIAQVSPFITFPVQEITDAFTFFQTWENLRAVYQVWNDWNEIKRFIILKERKYFELVQLASFTPALSSYPSSAQLNQRQMMRYSASELFVLYSKLQNWDQVIDWGNLLRPTEDIGSFINLPAAQRPASMQEVKALTRFSFPQAMQLFQYTNNWVRAADFAQLTWWTTEEIFRLLKLKPVPSYAQLSQIANQPPECIEAIFQVHPDWNDVDQWLTVVHRAPFEISQLTNTYTAMTIQQALDLEHYSLKEILEKVKPESLSDNVSALALERPKGGGITPPELKALTDANAIPAEWIEIHRPGHEIAALMTMELPPTPAQLKILSGLSLDELTSFFQVMLNWDEIGKWIQNINRPPHDIYLLAKLLPKPTLEDIQFLWEYSVSELTTLIRGFRSWIVVAEWAMLPRPPYEIVDLATRSPHPTLEQAMKLNRFSLDIITKSITLSWNWNDLADLAGTQRTVEDLHRLLSRETDTLTLAQIIQLDRFSMEWLELLHDTDHISWADIAEAAKSRRTALQIREAHAASVPLARIKELDGFTSDDFSAKVTNMASGVTTIDQAAAQATTMDNAARQQRFEIADTVIRLVKPKITAGPQNQIWAREVYGEDGTRNMATMSELLLPRFGDYSKTWNKPRRTGAAVMISGGGNCQDIAALTYNYLREYCPTGQTVSMVISHKSAHVFCLIGDLSTESREQIVVVDPWVLYARPVTLAEHFCRNDMNLQVAKTKNTQKPNRIATLIRPMNSRQEHLWPDEHTLKREAKWKKDYNRFNEIPYRATWNHSEP